MSELHYKTKKKKSGKGFYVALGICLVAIGLAAWATYDNVSQYTAPPESGVESESAYSQTEPENSGAMAGSSSETESSSQAAPSSSESPTDASKPESSPSSAPQIVTSRPESSQVDEEPSSSEPEEERSEASETQSEQQVIAQPANTSYVYPVGNVVNKEFSGTELMYSETMKDWRVHEGVDLAASVGDTVHAIGYGTVKEIYLDDMLGNVIVITHDDMDVYYCGLGSTALVKAGDQVSVGQDIGSVNLVPGESIEAPHLHLEIVREGLKIDPVSILP